MRQTTASGNDSGRYSEGNPGLGVPATVVSAEAANFWQEEIINTMVAAGIAESANETDLRDAILALIASGGGSTSTIDFTVANNQAAAANVTGLVFDKATVKAAKVTYAIDRSTDSSNEQSVGELMIVHDATDDVWRINDTAVLDDTGVTFSITSAGQVQYTSDDLTGTTYVGTLKAVSTTILL